MDNLKIENNLIIKENININMLQKLKLDISKNTCIMNAKDIHYKDLNFAIREIVKLIKEIRNSKTDEFYNLKHFENINEIKIDNVLGQRYIGDGIQEKISIKINGTPGNDLGAFMDGPEIEVFGNVQDGVGNTMNSGKIIVHGNAGDILGYSMRGGEIFVRGNVGYRSGIHMKSYLDKFPTIVIGGKAGNFLGEYMAGGIIIVLGIYDLKSLVKNFYLFDDNEVAGNYIGTGMHGGKIFIRGQFSDYKLGKEIIKLEIDDEDKELLKKYLNKYYEIFKIRKELQEKINLKDFVKLIPFSKRPYGKLYAY